MSEGRASIIDGKMVAGLVRDGVGAGVSQVIRDYGFTPRLAVVLVGQNPASEVYVRNKTKQAGLVGMETSDHKLAADIGQAELLDLITSLNEDEGVHGILVQLPLPPQIDEDMVIAAVDPAKDVDGFHPINVGRLWLGQPSLVPCTPQGCIILAREVTPDLTGLEAVVIGRSNIVGKPLAQLLLRENCTVTIAHSRTRDLPGVARRADLLIAATGQPKMVKGDWIKPGATVIDVGINRIDAPGGKTKLVGDVDFDEALDVAGAITPVPGGVGPMTIACLLSNTLQAACALKSVAVPEI
jgi:methylenetetrahydrofolate dehydrogenase (NADP+)/methenyltetrahydrofolate cyclohydrolase